MWPIVTSPWALLGLLSLPALAGIYWLRNRHRRYPVSNLSFWLDVRELKSGGPRIDRFRAPLLFFVELLILLLLALAAAESYWPTSTRVRPIIIVLDDSLSMRAGGDESARQKALRALRDELSKREGFEAQFIIAGRVPRLLPEKATSWSDAERILEQWTCTASSASLRLAMGSAAEIGRELAVILVLTDQASPFPLGRGRMQWWAFGTPRDNVAITSAIRAPTRGGDRWSIEVTGFTENERSVRLLLEGAVTRSIPLDLKPDEPTAIPAQTLPPGSGDLRARFESSDELPFDDRAWLVEKERSPLRVDIRMPKGLARNEVESAVTARGNVLLTADQPEIVFTDQLDRPPTPLGTWVVHLLAETDAVQYREPFTLHHGHDLADGLSLHGIVWAAGKVTDYPGFPVVLTSNDVPLVTETKRSDGARDVYLRIRHDQSTLGNNWVFLIVNLLDWRESRRPGIRRVNVALDERVDLSVGADVDEIVVIQPDGTETTMASARRELLLRGENVGVHEVRFGERRARFAVNAVLSEESDLRRATSGRWGNWLDRTTLRLEYRSVSWILLLAALGLLILHVYLARRLKRA